MREIPQPSKKLKALQDSISAEMERGEKAREKVAKERTVSANCISPCRQVYVPTIEDEYLMTQFQSGRYCGD